MNQTLAQMLQIFAWLMALIEFSVGLYILLLNIWHNANRHMSILLLIAAGSTLALGQMFTASNASQAAWSTVLLAITAPMIETWLLIITVILLKPDWMRGRWQWAWWLMYGLALLPVVLTLADLRLGTRLWYTGLDAQSYPGGIVSMSMYAAGRFALPIRLVTLYLMPLLALVPALWVILRDKKAPGLTRQLAWLILIVQIPAIGIQLGLRSLLTPGVSTLLTNTILAFGYAYAAFQQMVSERRLQRGRLQFRLTTLILAITAPLLASVAIFVTNRAGAQIQNDANERLRASQAAIKANTETWLDLNIRALRQLVSEPDIISMDPARQKPVLEAMARNYPHMYLVSTIDLTGMNVARNDSAALMNYSDREYFRKARDGAPLTFQVLIGRTTNTPALVASMPISRSGQIVGVGMFGSELTKITESLQAIKIGETGVAYVVSADNYLIAHPRPEVLLKNNQLVDASQFLPVLEFRHGKQSTNQLSSFTDEQGARWRYEAGAMNHDWVIIVQQQEAELLASLRQFQGIAWGALTVGLTFLLIMSWLTFRQAFQPINSLTTTVAAISAGDLARIAPVESEDEIGTLAKAFNSMTRQLRELIGGLEQRVAERTRELETRSRYLEAAAQVGRAASSILESDQLIRQVVGLIRDRFELYYVGLFLIEETGQWAVLRAGTGSAGQAMLARGHRLAVGESSMIGWCIRHAQARIALQAGQDAVRLATAELPDTRSEAALPLRSRGRILGALTVQSAQPQAFDQDTIVVLQTMSDQVAVALDNARLFAESQSALEATRRASAQSSREGWSKLVSLRPRVGYICTERGVTTAGDIWRPEMDQAKQEERTIQANRGGDEAKQALAVPIKVRGNVIAVLDTYKSGEGSNWTAEEIALLETLADQLGTALESARLFEDTQYRAAREQRVSAVTARMRESLDVETVIKIAAQETRQALGVPEVTIRLASPKKEASS